MRQRLISLRNKTLLHSFLVVLTATIPVLSQIPLETLYRQQRFFELRDELAKRPEETSPLLIFYRGIIANRFNRLTASNDLLVDYLKTSDPSHRREAHETIADNYLRLYDYRAAADEYKTLTDQYGGAVEKKLLDDYRNSAGIFESLRATPRQEVSIDGDFSIQGNRDTAGMLNLPVEVNGVNSDFVLDTGAELSVVTESTARKLNLTVIDTQHSVSTSTDIEVKSKLAVAPTLRLGKATIRNVVFLVFEDKDFYFPEAKYQINGIVGFPVIEAFECISISRSNLVKACSGDSGGSSNMFLQELKPVVEATVFGRKAGYTFDTGAVTSTFYPKFLIVNRSYIVRHAKLRPRKNGGAGGSRSVMAYMLKNMEMLIAGRKVIFPVAEIYPKSFNQESRTFYGNIGQDLIRQFEGMTLDFRAMKLRFY